jgi:hypothetical protein
VRQRIAKQAHDQQICPNQQAVEIDGFIHKRCDMGLPMN